MLLLTIADFFHHLFHHPSKFFEPEELVRIGGLVILFLIVYGQTGLFFCFFFPGDALIFSSGVLFASGTFHHSLYVILFFLISAAVLGNITGYWFGRKAGPLLLRRDSFFFKHDYLEAAEEFYNRHHGWAITAGMFLPIIRTFAPIIAGVLKLRFGKFFLYVLVGSSAWIGSLVSLGYFLGNFIWVRKNLHFIVIAMVVVITVPVLFRLIKGARSTRKRKSML